MPATVTTTTLVKPVALVVDHDVARRNFVGDSLTADGFPVTAVTTTDQAIKQCAAAPPDVAVVAVNGGSGLEFARQVRAGVADVDQRLPLMLIGGAFVERALHAGADDYVDDPREDYGELLARTRALIRRANLNGSARATRVTIGPLSIDHASREVRLSGDLVELSKKEYALLCALAKNPTAVITKDQLLRDVWGYRSQIGATRTLDSHACRLRNKLHVGGWSLIQNVWGVGYRLTDSASL
jgi:DNA-binding response OmpR family regulator